MTGRPRGAVAPTRHRHRGAPCRQARTGQGVRAVPLVEQAVESGRRAASDIRNPCADGPKAARLKNLVRNEAAAHRRAYPPRQHAGRLIDPRRPAGGWIVAGRAGEGRQPGAARSCLRFFTGTAVGVKRRQRSGALRQERRALTATVIASKRGASGAPNVGRGNELRRVVFCRRHPDAPRCWDDGSVGSVDGIIIATYV
jgi:hypothetical protein